MALLNGQRPKNIITDTRTNKDLLYCAKIVSISVIVREHESEGSLDYFLLKMDECMILLKSKMKLNALLHYFRF